MPELPDIALYIEALEKRVLGQALRNVRISSPFLLRTAVPPIQSLHERKVIQLRRIGKRIAFGFEDDFWLVLHLMIAGRLHWLGADTSAPKRDKTRSTKPGRKGALAVFEFGTGSLLLTEAGTKKR